MAVTGHGAGKLLLFGEHSAVYGHPALGLALPWQTEVSIRQTGLKEWQLPELLPEDQKNLRNLLAFLQEAFPYFKKLGGMEVAIQSNIPISMGFGSSAALCVAFVKAVVTLLAGKVLPKILVKEIGRSFDFIWALANKAERLFHGKPSGIDTGLSLLGNIQSFNFQGDVLPQSKTLISAPFFLVVGGVPRNSNTKKLVGAVGEKFESGDSGVKRTIDELGEIARIATRELNGNRKDVADQLGSLADEAHRLLSKLGLASPLMETLLDTGKKAGATGGKLSGAGAGGAFYLVAENKKKAMDIAKSLKEVHAFSHDYKDLPILVIRHNGKKTDIINF